MARKKRHARRRRNPVGSKWLPLVVAAAAGAGALYLYQITQSSATTAVVKA